MKVSVKAVEAIMFAAIQIISRESVGSFNYAFIENFHNVPTHNNGCITYEELLIEISNK